ncbi:MAG TPA: 16S rRNA (guanine(966)-N(2))-methyltransferase RsmD [Clostridia bacterium]|jgi:16S rRNA (guanine966-N2)-methyltransferase|nr:16S rRNA (guanine(966)-N(2))-methyltransferase RsmD [Clostridiaceae bacterium]HOF26020.1 16S rRNA (guanine(966)-N(2))-methyltransferase RsmD [Clostridia bacterium]HOM33537.1 16S rRNA (guanine(966)-N(2))-methyltransferase RsmD [Clostridia bacterium]HOR89197.1 16S rRNA (guanine(966)-N(2))-methyltransferase RsmD [Clostridia bacterium]HOT70105.1 16S rRNA (guanine(966)-N(2))-methyltransferase RsmD [Clostridia bacterium]
MPRIIAGSRKSIILEAPKGENVRPTYDRTKENLFNIISSRYPLEGAYVLDMFSGTGSIGLECLSRGAKYAVFIDKDVSLTRKNIEKCDFSDVSRTVRGDWATGLRILKEENIKFTHIFLDPPYHSGLHERIIENSDLYDIMGENGVVIAELSDKANVPENTAELVLKDKRKYGICVFAFYIKGSHEDLDMSGEL